MMGDPKETNPKLAIGVAKAPMSTVPTQVVQELGIAMMEGGLKYGRHNYRMAGCRSSVYYDAAMRHLMSWWEGQDIDPDSGLSHITKAMASLAVLRDCQISGNAVDDRPPSIAPEYTKGLNEIASNLLKKYPEPKPAFTIDDNKKAEDHTVAVMSFDNTPVWKCDCSLCKDGAFTSRMSNE